MTLSCSCDWDYDQDYDPGDWTYEWKDPESVDFEPLQTRRRVRCCSCNELIDLGALCLRHRRHRYPYDEIESRIKRGCDLETAMNDEPTIRMSDHYHCERCGEIWLNLQALGYECLSPNEDMEESLAEYHEMTGFKKEAV